MRTGARWARGALGSVPVVAGLLTLPPPLAAQSRFSPAFTTYGMADGLSHSSVTALVQDSLGFLWIGTQDGLNRYDGTGFKAYRHHPGDSTSLPDDFVEALALADSGRIWVGTQQGGLLRFDPLTGTNRQFSLQDLGPWRLDDPTGRTPGRVGRTVSRILVLGSGHVLLVTDVGLVLFDPGTEMATNLMPHPSAGQAGSHVTALAATATATGQALGGLSDGSFVLVDELGRIARAPPIALPDSASALVPYAGGYLAGTPHGSVWVLDAGLTSAREVIRLPARVAGDRPAVNDVLPTPDGSVWLATSRWAYRADPSNGVVTEIGAGTATRALPDADVTRVLADHGGLLWFGTWSGLASLHPLIGSIHPILAGSELAGGGIIALEDAPGGGLWLGAYGGGVQHLSGPEGSVNRRVTVPPGLDALEGAEVFGLAAGAHGELWIAAFTKGIWRMAKDGAAVPVSIVDLDAHHPEVTAYSVFVDHVGHVWAGIVPLGLVRYDRREDRFEPFTADATWDPGSNYVWPLAEDSRGRLWVGAYNGGVSVLSPDRTSSHHYRSGPGGLSSDRILTLFVDSRDEVWMGTEGDGLAHLDPETGHVTVWTTENGLPHDNVEGIVEDGRGYMWVTTNDGLVRLTPDTDEILVFREPAGLAGNRFYANGAHRGPDGTLYFGGPGGLTIVDPDAISLHAPPPAVALTDFRIQGREVPLARAVRTDQLVLAPDENFFAFDFAAMDFADVSQNRYRYMLEDLDPDWVDAGGTPVANYTSVPPGRYVFRVAARNSEGVWNDDALALPIRVLAPYYRTWWFRSLVTLAALSLAAGFYTYRLRQLEARQALRLEIAGKLHDDIGANLSNIALKADMMRTVGVVDERGSTFLDDVSRLARDTAYQVRETVWVVNTRYDTLPRLVGHMHDSADTLLSGQVTYRFVGPEQIPERPVTMEFRQNVYLLFKETLNNVVKHAGATRVDISVSASQKSLSFRIADDGVGFDPATVRDGNGQELMRSRAEAVGGRLAVTSAPGRGTVVDFVGPVR